MPRRNARTRRFSASRPDRPSRPTAPRPPCCARNGRDNTSSAPDCGRRNPGGNPRPARTWRPARSAWRSTCRARLRPWPFRLSPRPPALRRARRSPSNRQSRGRRTARRRRSGRWCGKNVDERRIGDLAGIEADGDDLAMPAPLVGLVCRVGRRAAGIAGRRRDHAGNLVEIRLDAPEAAAGEQRRLRLGSRRRQEGQVCEKQSGRGTKHRRISISLPIPTPPGKSFKITSATSVGEAP